MKILDECRFSAVSEFNVASCSPAMQRFLRKAIRCAPRYLDFAVICGHRNQLDQEEAYKKGASKVRWPNSKHNSWPSKAVDIRPAAPFAAKDWADSVRFARIVGFLEAVALEEGVKLRVGLDFNGDGRTLDESFVDLGHLEEAA